jgi:hypothetical protein
VVIGFFFVPSLVFAVAYFENWIELGRGLELLRQKAEQQGRSLNELREEAGLAEKEISESVVSKLKRVIDHLPAVEYCRREPHPHCGSRRVGQLESTLMLSLARTLMRAFVPLMRNVWRTQRSSARTFIALLRPLRG